MLDISESMSLKTLRQQTNIQYFQKKIKTSIGLTRQAAKY